MDSCVEQGSSGNLFTPRCQRSDDNPTLPKRATGTEDCPNLIPIDQGGKGMNDTNFCALRKARFDWVGWNTEWVTCSLVTRLKSFLSANISRSLMRCDLVPLFVSHSTSTLMGMSPMCDFYWHVIMAFTLSDCRNNQRWILGFRTRLHCFQGSLNFKFNFFSSSLILVAILFSTLRGKTPVFSSFFTFFF